MATARKPKTSDKAIEMNDLLLTSNRFVVGDIETTTFSPEKGGRIIEVAGVKIENGKIVGTYSQLINPEMKIPKKITELTGISDEMVKGKPVYGTILPEFYQFIEDAVFVAHNKMFDWDRFLKYYFQKVGIIAQNQTICTRILGKLYYPYLKEHTLSSICNQVDVNIGNHHRALDDSEALAHVIMKWRDTEAKKYDTKGIFVPFTQQVVQQDLFAEPIVEQEKGVSVETPSSFKVKRVSYWEKDITKQKKMQRIYALLSIGTVFFDIPNNAWYNKDVKTNVDFDEIERRILGYLKLNTRAELSAFRGVK